MFAHCGGPAAIQGVDAIAHSQHVQLVKLVGRLLLALDMHEQCIVDWLAVSFSVATFCDRK